MNWIDRNKKINHIFCCFMQILHIIYFLRKYKIKKKNSMPKIDHKMLMRNISLKLIHPPPSHFFPFHYLVPNCLWSPNDGRLGPNPPPIPPIVVRIWCDPPRWDNAGDGQSSNVLLTLLVLLSDSTIGGSFNILHFCFWEFGPKPLSIIPPSLVPLLEGLVPSEIELVADERAASNSSK